MARQITIFYSWQSDSPPSTNRYFIEDCLDRAIKKLKKDVELKIEPTLDRDTKDVPGSPDIVDTINAKIRNSHIFVGDVSIINPGGPRRPTPNPNVVIELGYALAYLGSEGIICIFNEAFGTVDDLPFDIRQKRLGSYHLKEKRAPGWLWRKLIDPVLTWWRTRKGAKQEKNREEDQEKTSQREELVGLLEQAVRDILDTPDPAAILASCRAANAAALQELRAHGRYDLDRYLFREADRRLFQVWQRAWRGGGKEGERGETVRLIALVNDSGFGKSSLLCSFVESLSPCLPVLLLQARHLAFDTEDCIIRAVVQSLPGALLPDLSKLGEAAAASHLARHARFTVVLDGLDEAGQPAAVQRAVRHWLHSPFGQQGVLVVSSRREFWRKCVDRAWGGWMPGQQQEDREAAAPAGPDEGDPAQGLRLPGLFTPEELERAWVRAGQPPTAQHDLAGEVQEELRHPFTLRAFLDLQGQAGPVSQRTRTDIMSAWIDVRLQKEEDLAAHLTPAVYRDALRVVARRIEEGQQGWVGVDRLDEVPRYDQASPPGPAVGRLLHAGILEPLPGHADRIRFVFEAVQDFFLGEDDADLVERDPDLAATRLAEGTYSEAYIRLDRLGRRIAGASRRGEFLAALADRDAVRAAVVLRACPSEYQPDLREKIVARLKQDVTSRHRVKGAFAVETLGRIDCQESCRALIEALPTLGDCPMHLRITGALALARLGCVEGARFVYAYPWFGLQGDAYYFEDTIALMRGTSPQFKATLADHAVQSLDADSGTAEHGRAACVLAHLRDDRLVANLQGRLASNGLLQGYENHALFASGTEAAVRLFGESARKAADKLSGMGYDDGGLGRYEVFASVSPKSADLRYLTTPAFEVEVERLLQDKNEEVAGIGTDLAESSKSLRLLHASLVAQARRQGLRSLSTDRVADIVDPRTWMSWWVATGSPKVRGMLLKAMSPVPSVEVEQVLIGCLDDPVLRSAAASLLGHFGSYRAAARLRQLLGEGLRGWDALEVVRAVGRLGEPRAAGLLAQLARESKGDLLSLVVVSLGAIRTQEAERELLALLKAGTDADWVVSGLFFHGSQAAVARVVNESRRPGRGPKWLAQRMRRTFFWWGHTVGRYYTHVRDEELIRYLEANEQDFRGKEKWDLLHAVEQIDSENVRRLLRILASQSGTPEDAVVRENDGLRASTLAYQELLYRGDSSAVGHFVGEAISRDRRRAWVARDLGRLPREEVASQLRLALARPGGDEERAAIVRLLGFFGVADDADLVRPFVDSGDDPLANAAYEALCRLTEPSWFRRSGAAYDAPSPLTGQTLSTSM
jgi:hypothetical protein